MIAPALPSTDSVTQQVVNGDRNQVIGHVSGGTIIYITGNYVNGDVYGSETSGSPISGEHYFPQPKRRPQPIQLAPKSFPLLLGRQVEIKLATDTLPYHQPLEFYGASGIGKTVLLRYVAHHPAIAPAFPAGLIYLRHRCYQSVSDLLQVLYEAFYETPTPTKPTDVVIRQALAGCQALVLLDEAALPATELEQLINELPDLTFVFAAEAHQLMGDGKAMALDGLANEDAIALITRELGQPLSEIEQQAALAIAAALKGHPRQILQAIALTRETGMSLAAVAKQFQKPGHLLASLNNAQRRVLALLAVLAGSALAAEHIADIVGIPAVQPILDLLQRRHLIERAEAGYRVLDKVALPAEEFAHWRDRSIEYFTQWLQQQGGTLETMEEAEALFRCLDWAVEGSQWHDAAILGQALEKAFSLSGQWDAWEQSLQWLLQSAQASGNQALEGYALHQLGTRALCLNQLTTAQAYLEQARDIRTALNDPALEVTLQNLSSLHAPPLPPSPPAPPASPLPSKGKALLVGGVAAVVALLGYVTWNVARPISSEPATVGLTGLVDILSDLPPIVLPDNESCTNYRVASENGEAAIAQISSISITQPQSVSQAAGQIQVRPGETVSGTIQLNCEAPSTGLSLDMTLRKDTASQSLEKVTVQSSQKQGSFQIQVPADYPAGQATLIASHPDLQEATRTLNIIRSTTPTPDPQPPDPTCPDSDTVLDLTLNATEAEPGETLRGTVSIDCAPQGRVLVRLNSSQPSFAVPESVVIPAGTQTASFNITVPTSYPSQEPVTITAIANDTLRDVEQLTVQIPQDPQDPQQAECDRKRLLYQEGAISANDLIQLAVQNEVNWSSTVTVQIALACPSPSGVSSVQLASDDSYLVQNLPSAIAVESGTSTFSFDVPADGDNYPKGKQVTITATYDGYSATLPINIPPFPDPPVSTNPSFSANPATGNTNSQSQQVQLD